MSRFLVPTSRGFWSLCVQRVGIRIPSAVRASLPLGILLVLVGVAAAAAVRGAGLRGVSGGCVAPVKLIEL